MFKLFKRKIKLESFEVRIIINSLKAMRNKLIENNEASESILGVFYKKVMYFIVYKIWLKQAYSKE